MQEFNTSKSSTELLSDLTVFMKYAKYDELLQRRETWEELVHRNKEMHLNHLPGLSPELCKKEIEWAYQFVLDKKVLPSMRSMQFAGKPIMTNPARGYNCSFMHMNHYKAFSETMFLLLSGVGCGYSVQKHHVDQLPTIKQPKYINKRRYLISDDIEGWAEAIKILLKSYFFGTEDVRFDYRGIRSKGMRLVTSGGKAPGFEPLEECINKIKQVLDNCIALYGINCKLRPIDVHDIQCHIANAVLAGGIRRSAMISLFDYDDQDMLTCKFGEWWIDNEQRGRCNNSAVLLRGSITSEQFFILWDKIKISGCGEPGIFWTNDKELGTNPCCFSYDTQLLTTEGYKSIGDLAIEGNCQLINKKGETQEGFVWLSKENVDVISLKLSNKKTITCTPEHKLMDVDGNTVEAKDTKGLRLRPYYVINNEVNAFTKLGFIQGDAATGRLGSEQHKGLEIFFGDNDLDVAILFGYNKTGKEYVTGFNDVLKEYGFSANQLPYRCLPSSYDSWSDKNKLMFLKGLYSANGCIITEARIALKSTCKELVEQVKKSLEAFGIKPYITVNKTKDIQFSNGLYTCKESYDLNIGNIKDIIWFAENIGFVHAYKQKALEATILSKAPIVLKITNDSKQDVYDFTIEDDEHWGVVEGIIAHNCEIALHSNQFCNLCEINASNITSQEDFLERVKAATIIGTLQASYTDFHYLRPEWKQVTEKEALLGIGLTGIASNTLFEDYIDFESATAMMRHTNKMWAERLHIKKAARLSCVKPSGTSSLVLGTSSGIHAWHNDFYVRRIRVNKQESIHTYLESVIGGTDLYEDCKFNPSTTAILAIPVKAPEGASLRTESALSLLHRVKTISDNWIVPGHRSGENRNNVSVTVSIKDDEWETVGNWMWENRESYSGISVLPYDGGTYVQAPFQDITETEYNRLTKIIESSNFDLTNVIEYEDKTNHIDNVACSGGACEII